MVRLFLPMLVVVILADTSPKRTRPGLIGEYYDISSALSDFPSLERRKPVLVRVDKQVYFEPTDEPFPGTKLVDYFYVRWTGRIRIPEDGRYRFALDSDDGSRLWIDGKKVVENGGLHSMVRGQGTVQLRAGNRDIRIEFFENEGGAGIKLFWARGKGEMVAVPAQALCHAQR